MLIEPHSLGIVPSSSAVTMGLAICWPSLPQNSELPSATCVASSEWPQASWKITPPKPLSMMTGITPAGHSSALSMVTAQRAASRAVASGSTYFSNSSKPRIAPGPSKPVWFSTPLLATA